MHVLESVSLLLRSVSKWVTIMGLSLSIYVCVCTYAQSRTVKCYGWLATFCATSTSSTCTTSY